MVGGLGNEYLAASQLANGVFYVMHSLLMGITFGVTASIGAHIGKYNYKEAAKTFKHSLLINVSVAAILTLLSVFISKQLVHLNSNIEIAHLAQPYFLIITACSFIFSSIFYSLVRYLEAVSKAKVILFTNILFCISNVFLNYLFIYGNCGFKARGLVGAGLGTLWSLILSLVILVVYLFTAKDVRRYFFYIKKSTKFSIERLINILKVGLTIGFHQVLEVGFSIVTVVMLGWLSIEEQAANSILDNLMRVLYLITWAFSTASCIMVSSNTYVLPKCSMKKLGTICFLTSTTVVMGIFFVVNLVLPLILHLYASDQKVLEIIHESRSITGVFILFDCLYMVGLGMLRGLKDTFFPFLVTTGVNWFIGLPLCYYLIFIKKLGVFGSWIGATVSFAIISAFMLIRFYMRLNKASIQNNFPIKKPDEIL